jgi:hypothetical protein
LFSNIASDKYQFHLVQVVLAGVTHIYVKLFHIVGLRVQLYTNVQFTYTLPLHPEYVNITLYQVFVLIVYQVFLSLFHHQVRNILDFCTYIQNELVHSLPPNARENCHILFVVFNQIDAVNVGFQVNRLQLL